MASATQSLTTYYAKRIIGDAAAASETSALLQTGTGVTTNTWILHRTNRNNLYGIKYLYDSSTGGQADKIELYGGNVVSNTDTPTAWVELDTGDMYIMGKVGIGYNPNTTGNTCKLYVNGTLLATSYITSGIEGSDGSTSQTGLVAATTGGRIVLFMNPDDTNSERTCGLWVSAHGTGTDKNILLVDTNNNTTFYGTLTGTADYATSLYKRFSLVKGTNPSATTWLSNWFNYQTGTTFNESDRIGGGIYSYISTNGDSGLALTAYQNSTTNINNARIEIISQQSAIPYISVYGQLIIQPENSEHEGGQIQLVKGPSDTSSCYIDTAYNSFRIHSGGKVLFTVGLTEGSFTTLNLGPLWIQGGSEAGGNKNRLTTTSGMPGNMQYGSHRRGTQIYSNGIAFADPYGGDSNNDAAWIRHTETTANTGELEIAVGDDCSNETIVCRQYKTNNTVGRTLTLLDGSGNSSFPGNITLPSGGRLGKASGNMYIGDSGNSGWVLTQDICSHTSAGDGYWSARVNGTGHFKTVYGAVWNDYAEMRNVPQAQTNIERIYDNKGEIDRNYPYAGHCVHEVGDGTMKLVNKRLEKGCKIISDTFGFCIGETKDCCTPIAVTGRVLVYPYEDINDFKNHIGDCVCSGPNGTVSIMTDEEKIQHPECIVGTISEIPTYDIWYCGNKTTKPIDVNGRIWIYVK